MRSLLSCILERIEQLGLKTSGSRSRTYVETKQITVEVYVFMQDIPELFSIRFLLDEQSSEEEVIQKVDNIFKKYTSSLYKRLSRKV